MGRPRQELQALLKEVAGDGVSVYFQPPSSISMKYPAIVYQRDTADTRFANDKPYSFTLRYQITVIDRNPDSEIPDKVTELPMTSFERFFVADGLNHNVFMTYF